jgi:hypothetical protein
MSRILRHWRIAFSALCGLAAVLFALLWVRSCSISDDLVIPLPGSWSVGVGTGPGSCGMGISTQSPNRFEWNTIDVDVLRPVVPAEYLKYYTGIWGCFDYVDTISPLVIVPDWFLIGVAIALSAAPWIRWPNRFSLRTLLVATTLVAAVLGLIVWSINR